jgi:hypothetical protein
MLKYDIKYFPWKYKDYLAMVISSILLILITYFVFDKIFDKINIIFIFSLINWIICFIILFLGGTIYISKIFQRKISFTVFNNYLEANNYIINFVDIQMIKMSKMYNEKIVIGHLLTIRYMGKNRKKQIKMYLPMGISENEKRNIQLFLSFESELIEKYNKRSVI